MPVFQDDKVPQLRESLCVKENQRVTSWYLRLMRLFLRPRQKTRQVSLIEEFALAHY